MPTGPFYSLPNLRAHFEDCIVYHEQTIARCERMHARFGHYQRAHRPETALLAKIIAREKHALERLHEAVTRSQWPLERD
jgi:hypothetical protein